MCVTKIHIFCSADRPQIPLLWIAGKFFFPDAVRFCWRKQFGFFLPKTNAYLTVRSACLCARFILWSCFEHNTDHFFFRCCFVLCYSPCDVQKHSHAPFSVVYYNIVLVRIYHMYRAVTTAMVALYIPTTRYG